MTIDEMIEVMQAYKDGRKIEYRYLDSSDDSWYDLTDPKWNWSGYEYRIKPDRYEKDNFFYHYTIDELMEKIKKLEKDFDEYKLDHLKFHHTKGLYL